MSELGTLLQAVRACRQCAPSLPHAPRPVLVVQPEARVLIAGQAPGRRVHESGVPWDDRSGDRLRDWLGLTREAFYSDPRIAIVPMGFCYPGTVNGADLPPRRECAPLWRAQVLAHLSALRLTLLVGAYAQRWHLGQRSGRASDLVRDWRSHAPHVFPLPHPSWRNTGWLKKNPWFERDLLPDLRSALCLALS